MAEASAAKGTKKKIKLVEYLKGVRTELRKVVWPTRKETLRYTVIVIVVCLFFALFFWLLDTGFLALLQAVLNITM